MRIWKKNTHTHNNEQLQFNKHHVKYGKCWLTMNRLAIPKSTDANLTQIDSN